MAAKVNNREHGMTHKIPCIGILAENLTPFKSFPLIILPTDILI